MFQNHKSDGNILMPVTGLVGNLLKYIVFWNMCLIVISEESDFPKTVFSWVAWKQSDEAFLCNMLLNIASDLILIFLEERRE